ncbi:MAG TPA: right-handed parallel beta-helix repeat-containing protein [Thermoanaerobaculia bacterium]|nr:right-handed parallel beta-helix repeat-containing protein [Thermoanaerobaculia bacterium]
MQRFRFAVVVAVCLLITPAIFAQATRTWVSGVGDDANPCSRTAPCKTFAGAISKTAAGGEISVLDPGGFGAVNITKSITLNGEGTLASILFSGTNGVIVNGSGIIVNLVNLSLNGGTPTSPGINGVRIIAAAHVSVSNCDIYNYSNVGILDERTTAGALTVSNTRIHNSIQSGANVTTVGIRLLPSGGATAANTLTCDRCTIWGNNLSNSFGIFLSNGGKATITRSNVSGNTFGIGAGASAGTATATISQSDFSNNGTGVRATAGGTIRLAQVTITGSTVNGLDFGGGTINTFTNTNFIAGNTGNNGAGLTPIAPQ